MSNHKYSQHFYDFVEKSAGQSASIFIKKLKLGYPITSILDIGCGLGVWLKAWEQLGAKDIVGIDGKYVNQHELRIPLERFLPMDISKPFNLNRRFDLVQCLEVAEHIDESSAECLIRSLTHHGDIILFSAALPGQGGEHHVNEQPLEYWAEHFAQLNYRAFDYPRQCTKDATKIEPWYRYNTVIYANDAGIAKLKSEVLTYEQPRNTNFPKVAPLAWRLRCLLIKLLPVPTVNLLSKVKHIWILRKLR